MQSAPASELHGELTTTMNSLYFLFSITVNETDISTCNNISAERNYVAIFCISSATPRMWWGNDQNRSTDRHK